MTDTTSLRQAAPGDGHPLVVDGHNDLPWAMRKVHYDFDAVDIARSQPQLHTDLPRLAAGGVGGQFWSVFVPCSLTGQQAVTATLEQIDAVYLMIERYPDRLLLVTSADGLDATLAEGKRVASLMGAEGGHSIDNSLGTLRALYRLGVRYLTLTHNENTAWADSATDVPAAGGLTAFGREVVREMNRLGMLVDLSHVAPTTMQDALDTTEAPVIFSHSSALGICDHPRNVPDEILAQLPGNGGVCMVNFVPAFVSPVVRDWNREVQTAAEESGVDTRDLAAMEDYVQSYPTPAPHAGLADVVAHCERIRDVAGVDHIGIGGDFDGITSVPIGLEDVSTYPALLDALAARSWSADDLVKLTHGNLSRTFHAAEAVAVRVRQQRGPSIARLEQLDGPVPSGQA
ncbi:MAG TPA: dipeptidase [Propionibacteriaceae bacterium]